MSKHTSYGKRFQAQGAKTVLPRYDRIAILKKEGRLDKDSHKVTGLPKTRS
ncbi:small basic protein [bacterium]|nr:small basic protein [bacterium]